MITTSRAVAETKNATSGNSRISSIFFQPKLTVNQPGDEYEQEADAVADKVMRMHGDTIQQAFFKPSSIFIQRKCTDCEAEEEQRLHQNPSNTQAAVTPSTESYITSLSGGQPLNESERRFFQPRLGYDFSNVRLHNDISANQSAKGVNALAYTHGNDIVFGSNQYQPETDEGKRLLAHELTHVVQQNAGIKRYVIQRDVGWAARGTPYGPPLTSERSTRVTETISNAPTGKEAWNGTFSWTSEFGLSYDLNTGNVTVVMKLHSSADAAVKTKWKISIESKWGNRFKIDTLKEDKSVLKSNPILVDIQWVADAKDAHYTITPHDPGATYGGRAGLGGTTSMTDWGTSDTTDITHEFGHMLGNAEEYFTTNGVDYTAGGTKQGYRDPGGGIMNNPSENPEARHYESVKIEYANLNGLSTSLVRVTSI